MGRKNVRGTIPQEPRDVAERRAEKRKRKRDKLDARPKIKTDISRSQSKIDFRNQWS